MAEDDDKKEVVTEETATEKSQTALERIRKNAGKKIVAGAAALTLGTTVPTAASAQPKSDDKEYVYCSPDEATHYLTTKNGNKIPVKVKETNSQSSNQGATYSAQQFQETQRQQAQASQARRTAAVAASATNPLPGLSAGEVIEYEGHTLVRDPQLSHGLKRNYVGAYVSLSEEEANLPYENRHVWFVPADRGRVQKYTFSNAMHNYKLGQRQYFIKHPGGLGRFSAFSHYGVRVSPRGASVGVNTPAGRVRIHTDGRNVGFSIDGIIR